MTDPRFPNFKYPEGRSPLLVRVFNLSPSSEEQVVKDFFRFCGKIDDFAMIKTENGNSLEALICFEKEGAAKTALMLSNATIGDRVIKVEPFYKDTNPEAAQAESNEVPGTSRGHQADDSQNKASTSSATSNYFSTLLSTGFQLTQTVLHGAKTLDETYGISTQAAAYIEKAKAETKKLDEKYHVSERAVDIDSKLGIRDKLTQAVSTATVLGKQALETEQGKKVYGLYEKAASTAYELRDEAFRAIHLDTNASASNTQPDSTLAPNSDANPEEPSTSAKNTDKSPSTEPAKPNHA